jgi:hypothetical protein
VAVVQQGGYRINAGETQAAMMCPVAEGEEAALITAADMQPSVLKLDDVST